MYVSICEPCRNENPGGSRKEHGEIPCHRKGKGSLTMQISQGLVDPNQPPNWTARERESG